MSDLSEIKKVIISLMNLYPNGVPADILNKAYESIESRKIPFADFGYHSLLAFFEEELKANVRIEYGDMQTFLYPIANEKSAHIIKMKQEELNKNSKKQKHSPRTSNASGSGNQNAHSSQTASTQVQQVPSTSQQHRSPTMPRLVQYKPFGNNNGLSRTQQKTFQDRLQQSKKAFMLRHNFLPDERGLRGTRGQRRMQNSNQKVDANNSNTNSNGNEQSSDSWPSSGKRSSIHSQLEKINNKVQAKKDELMNTSANEVKAQPQMQTQASTHEQARSPPKPVTPVEQTKTKESNEKISWESSRENLWDDELENVEQATVPLKSKADTGASSLYYGVSDTEDEAGPQSSVELLRQRMADPLFSDEEEEETVQNEIKGILADLHVGDTLPVRISDANSPLKFWVHVRLDKYKQQMDTLYKDMGDFYGRNRHSDDLKVTDPDEPNSQYFAVDYLKQWHRVEPLDTKMGESLRVSFIDHGTREIVNISQMRKLPKQFWTAPKAALCCALGNIKPTGKEFTNDSVDALINLLEGEKLWARILHIDNTKSKATVELILDSTKVCVNDEMIRLGHAVPKRTRSNA